MMDSLAFGFQELDQRRIRLGRLNELDVRFADPEEAYLRFLGGDHLNARKREACHGLIELGSFFEVIDGNGDVVDFLDHFELLYCGTLDPRCWILVFPRIKSSVSSSGFYVLSNVFDDLFSGGAGLKDLADSGPFQSRDIIGRDDSASQDDDVAGTLLPEELDDFRKESVVGARETREADDIDPFLDRRVCNLFGRLANAGLDHFHAGIPEGAGDDLCAPVVAVKAGFSNKDTNLTHGALPIRVRSNLVRSSESSG